MEPRCSLKSWLNVRSSQQYLLIAMIFRVQSVADGRRSGNDGTGQ